MPTYRVKLPDGHTYAVSSPTELSDAEVYQHATAGAGPSADTGINEGVTSKPGADQGGDILLGNLGGAIRGLGSIGPGSFDINHALEASGLVDKGRLTAPDTENDGSPLLRGAVKSAGDAYLGGKLAGVVGSGLSRMLPAAQESAPVASSILDASGNPMMKPGAPTPGMLERLLATVPDKSALAKLALKAVAQGAGYSGAHSILSQLLSK